MSYVGTKYHGWQIQSNAVTVQGELNRVLSIVSGEEIYTLGCGRTDTGVHALNFFCHFDCEAKLSDQNYLNRINKMLPHDIAVKRIFEVKPDAHTRFDATSRTYEYRIHYQKLPFYYKRSYYMHYNLNLELMNAAANILFEHKNFECFCKGNTQVTSFECEVMLAEWVETDEGLLFTIKANRFLRNMVRAIVGSLIEVGRGILTLEQFTQVIESRNRSEAGISVPAHGLYLSEIIYPEIN